jgi:hypothetical protein
VAEAVQDLLGNDVKVDDVIVYAATDGRSAGLRIGTILKITPAVESERRYDRKPAKIQVKVHQSTGYWAPEKPTTIDSSLKRFLLLRAADYEVLAAAL